MKNCREEWYDARAKVAVTVVDVTDAAQTLVRGHLAGPTSAHYLTEALAAAALLGAELDLPESSLSLQMKCKGPLGGLNVECTAAGTLRGYTEKKILDDFDGLGRPDDAKVIGERLIQVTQSVPGKILSQGVANSLDAYLAESLQRKAFIRVLATVSDEVEILTARGLLVEALPDSGVSIDGMGSVDLSAGSRTILKHLGFDGAELRRTTPIMFACRCSQERARDLLAALPEKDRSALPADVAITCHMCGRTYTL